MQHALEMVEEKLYRGGNLHFCKTFIEWCDKNFPILPRTHLTLPVQAMPDEYKNVDPVQAYRDYYWYNKRVNIDMRWTRREKPEWWSE